MADLNGLFNSALDDGDISQQALAILTAPDVGMNVQNAMGVSVDDIDAAGSETVLVTMMPDDSGSIAMAGNEQTVRDGHNLVLDALKDSKGSFLTMTRLLNGEVIFPYVPLAQSVFLDGNNYQGNKGTPLYDNTVYVLGSVLAKFKELTDAGITCRTVTLLITDGEDMHSRRYGSQDCRTIIQDMLAEETNHIIAGMAIENGRIDPRQVFTDMGIPDQWVLSAKDDPHSIREAFQVFSKSAVRASQGAGAFSQVAAGGFGG